MYAQLAQRVSAMVACLVAVMLFVYAAPDRLAVGTMLRVWVNVTEKEHSLVANVVSFTRDTYIMQAIILVYAGVIFYTTFHEPHHILSRHIMVPTAAAFAVLHVAVASNVCDATALTAIFILTQLTVRVALQSADCPQPVRRELSRGLIVASIAVCTMIAANIIAAASIITSGQAAVSVVQLLLIIGMVGLCVLYKICLLTDMLVILILSICALRGTAY